MGTAEPSPRQLRALPRQAIRIREVANGLARIGVIRAERREREARAVAAEDRIRASIPTRLNSSLRLNSLFCAQSIRNDGAYQKSRPESVSPSRRTAPTEPSRSQLREIPRRTKALPPTPRTRLASPDGSVAAVAWQPARSHIGAATSPTVIRRIACIQRARRMISTVAFRCLRFSAITRLIP